MSFFRRMFGGDSPNDNLRIVITRHGERADLAYGKQWLNKMLENGGHDPRISHLAPRPHVRDWYYDPPLTVEGENQSAHVGRKLRELGFPIDYCYSSPSFRSIQTASKILQSQGRKSVSINIEPGLFECPSWYAGKPLVFIPPEYVASDRRFNINTRYIPIYNDVDASEEERLYYRRSRQLIREIIQTHKDQGGTVLLSGHGGSIEAVTRGLRGLRQRRGRPEQLIQEALRVDYCNFAILERDARTRNWTVRSPELYSGAYGPQLSRQSIIPLYGLSTEHLTRQAAGHAGAQRVHRTQTKHRQQHHHQHQHQHQHHQHYYN